MPKKIYRVEVELRVTSLDVSRDEIPVAKTPTWQEVLGILELSQIEAESFASFKGCMLYGELAKIYQRMAETLKNKKPRKNKKTTLV